MIIWLCVDYYMKIWYIFQSTIGCNYEERCTQTCEAAGQRRPKFCTIQLKDKSRLQAVNLLLQYTNIYKYILKIEYYFGKKQRRKNVKRMKVIYSFCIL